MNNNYENTKALISVIVPVYNIMNYLEDCVNSIRKQTYKNIEIILVNDGSTDESKKVCQKLMMEEPRIHYYEKQNSGLSDTRNAGIQHANGEYIMFVDGDDIIEHTIIEHLYLLMKNTDAKIASCDIAHFADDEKAEFKRSTEERSFDTNEALRSFFYQKEISTSACGKLYNKNIFTNLRFMSGILFEDNEFLYQALVQAEKISYSNAKFYGYRHRKNSITTTQITIRDLDILDIGKRAIEYFKNSSIEVIKAIKAYQCSNCFRIYLTAPDEIEFSEAISYCKNYLNDNCAEVLKDENIRKKLYIALVLYRLHIPRKGLIVFHKRIERWK